MRAMRCVPPAPGNNPILISGRPSRVLGFFGGNAMMAGERELEAAAHGGAVERADPRLAAGFDTPVKQRQLAAFLEHESRGRFLAFVLNQVGKYRAHAFEHGEISAAAEGILARGDDRALDRGSLATFSTTAQLLDHVHRDDVHRAAGHVPGDQRDAVGVDVEFEIRHGAGSYFG